MKGVILLNGEPPENFITVQNDTVVVCCDGALKWAKQKINKIDEIVGDFDSLGYVPQGAKVFPVEKDDTDAMLAARRFPRRKKLYRRRNGARYSY